VSVEQLREYRSRLWNDLTERVDTLIAHQGAGTLTPEELMNLAQYGDLIQKRMRILNTEIDRLVAAH
jgi:hypothetical protein